MTAGTPRRRRLDVRFRLLAGLAILALWSSGPARALSDEEIYRDLAYGFITPGARALGMGGAFAAIADDATAAWANPAGLNNLADPQAFIEFRSIDPDPDDSRSSFGSLEVDLTTGARDLPYLSVGSASEADANGEASFASYVHPFTFGPAGRRASVAASRQVLLSVDDSLGGTGAMFSFPSFPNVVNGSTVEAYAVSAPVSGSSDIDIVYWNVGGAIEVHPDFSVGLTVSQATLDMKVDTVTRVNDPLQLFLDPSNPRRPAQPSMDVVETRVDDDDTDLAYTLGVYLKPDSAFASGWSPWSFGAVYRKGASFSVREQTFLNGLPDAGFDNEVVVPDRYGFGATYRTRRHWMFSVEIERVEYSDMLDGFETGVSFLTSERLADGAFATDPDLRIDYDVDDGTVPRVGAQYSRSLRGHPGRRLSFWGGYYRMPDARIAMTSFNSTDDDVNRVYLDAFGGTDETDHVTGGVGYSFGRSTFQVAGETSDRGTQVVGSYIFRIRKAKNVIGSLDAQEQP